MPTVVKCRECGTVLAEYPGIPGHAYGGTSAWWYLILYKKLNGKCPNCNHHLPNFTEFPAKAQFTVKPNPETESKSPLAGAFKHDYHNR